VENCPELYVCTLPISLATQPQQTLPPQSIPLATQPQQTLPQPSPLTTIPNLVSRHF